MVFNSTVSITVDKISFQLLKFHHLINLYSYTYYRLPCPRRHMAVKFIKNRLYLIGGVGHHRLKLSSVDVLDIHTGN